MSYRVDCEAIVIGAGLAGLSCAAHLAKAGKRVVVVEQHSRPGGLWSSFSRRRLVFDLSTHWVTEPQTLNRMLEDLGAQPVDFVQLERLGRYVGPPVAPGTAGSAETPPAYSAAAGPAWDITVGPDVEGFKQSVRASFPTVPEEALDDLVTAALDTSRCLDAVPVYSHELTSAWARARTDLSAARHLIRLRRVTTTLAARFFEDLFPNDDLAGLRAALHMLAPIPGISAIGPLAILGTGLRGRLYAPRGGSQALADAFAHAALLNGAEIRYSRRVVSILTEDREVRGVLLDDRTELHAPVVVSAADAKQTFYRMLGRDRIPDSYGKLLESQSVSESLGLISLVTTLEPAAFGFDGTDVFVCPSADVSHALESKEPEDCFFMLAFPQYSALRSDRSLRAVQIVVPASYAWREHWETWPTPERGAEYRALKEEWSTKIIERAQEYLPRLSSHLLVKDVATPITFYRYTLNTEGAPVGWHYNSRRRWKQRVPFIRGLYQAGHWVGPSGAVPVTRSGAWAAELILRDTAG